MRLISFSLFGSDPRYNRGAVENARLAPEFYPGWRCRFYCDPAVTAAGELESLGCEVVRMCFAPGALAMSWRFLPAADPSLERVIFRDCDSRLNPREAAAVAQWIGSTLPMHAMHDHEHHRPWPVFGGMWGCVGGWLPEMPAWIAARTEWSERLDDMVLLREHVHPLSAHACLRHSSVEVPWRSVPFPPHAPWDGFVGRQEGAA